ncbi:hypothetical protein KUTeg_024508 [Tegillarca granosa]|uniref:Uncharacterized protein n=1 Tax=Tegillarca granosa TaxID=220873 RepID=A0ABQ9E269_TEGGR|nr:hypothetical protein KUTeg_024508 [Tegillarca granosa]
MDYSEESDLDSTVTPIERKPYSQHGGIIESDSLSDFFLHEERRTAKHTHGRKKNVLNVNESNGEVSQRKGNFKEIYKELQIISEKLKNENKILRDREQKLRERERMVSISTENLKMISDHETKEKLHAMEEKYVGEVTRLELVLKEKNKENKRLKESFETLKLANDALKKDFENLQSQHEKLEKQTLSVQSRLTNLQRKKEFEQRQKEFDSSIPSVSTSSSVPKQKWSKDGEDKSKFLKQLKQPSSTCAFDVMSILLDWICDAHLRYSITEQPTKPIERFSSTEYIQEKVLKKNSLSSTFRRLGEELYRGRTVRFNDSDRMSISGGGDNCTISPVKLEKVKDGIYLRIDLLAHVFDVLKNELKSDIAKELYLYYQSTPVVLQYLKPINKTFIGSAIDVFLQMSTDSPFQQPFLESCSNESWFRTIAMVLRAPSQDQKLLEKLSIILQKLSKIKTNRKYFEVYTIVGIIQELLRSCPTEQAFLALNLKSILFNLTTDGFEKI